MKVKDGFVLRDVMDEHIVMPAGTQMKEFEGVIVLSTTAAYAWELLQKDITRSELIRTMMAEFDADEKTISQDVDELIDRLNGYGVLENLD